MKKLLLLATLAATTMTAYAAWEPSAENHFVANQSGVCGIRVNDDTAELATSLTGEATIEDYTDNDVLNNKTDTTVIDIQYDFTDAQGLSESDQVQIEVIVDGDSTMLDPGDSSFDMNMDKNQKQLEVGMRTVDGSLLKSGDNTVTLTYNIRCE